MVERLKGKVKKTAGAVVGNDELRQEGALHEQKADALAEARRSDVDADRRQRQADDERRAAELTSEQRELRAQEGAESDRERIARQQVEARDAIEARHDQRSGAAEAIGRAMAVYGHQGPRHG